ncbi:MAG: ABC transporter ATP-binding protein [Erysipelothrix sp.]|nr:ABC transporter ATP-binding protein [Erysipelothrix sp.]
MSLLSVKNMTQRFGGVLAISDVSLTIEKGQKVGIIGPNGAGKTTFFNCLTGFYVPTEGSIEYKDADGKIIQLQKQRVDKITALGFARTFQNIRLFKEQSLLDNIKIAMDYNTKYSHFDAVFRTKNYYREERIIHEKAHQYLDITDLSEKAEWMAGSLSYGDQRRLEIARALATGAKTLFLDEPAAGMNPQETADLISFIDLIHEKFDLTIVLIEHDMNLVMTVCDHIYVLNYGQLIASGNPAEIKENPLVIEAYLGTGDDA